MDTVVVAPNIFVHQRATVYPTTRHLQEDVHVIETIIEQIEAGKLKNEEANERDKNNSNSGFFRGH